MKLDVGALRYLTAEDWRILMSIEMGMKNHELVPVELILKIGKLHRGGAFKAINNLHKFKLIYHENKIYDGYRLTYLGYDFLALKAMSMRDTVVSVGNQIGVGKESDIYAVSDSEGEERVLKLARLGRISFRAIKSKRDYLKNRKSASWIYMSRLAAAREHSFMKTLYDNGFPVPRPYDVSRHCVLMERIHGYPLCNVATLGDTKGVYVQLMQLIEKFARHGLIHCDFNEFNIMINEDGSRITVIDFPQMVSTDHENAQWYFERDVNCIVTYFGKRYAFQDDYVPKWDEVEKGTALRLDELVRASGVDTSRSMPKEESESEEEEGSAESGSDEGHNANVENAEEGEDGESDGSDEGGETLKQRERRMKRGQLTERERREMIRRNIKKQMDKNRDKRRYRESKRKGKRTRQAKERGEVRRIMKDCF